MSELKVTRAQRFEDKRKRLRDSETITKLKKQIAKILENPEIGKPMRHGRKGTRELRVKPFRLSYYFSRDDSEIIFLDFYHKDEQ